MPTITQFAEKDLPTTKYLSKTSTGIEQTYWEEIHFAYMKLLTVTNSVKWLMAIEA